MWIERGKGEGKNREEREGGKGEEELTMLARLLETLLRVLRVRHACAETGLGC